MRNNVLTSSHLSSKITRLPNQYGRNIVQPAQEVVLGRLRHCYVDAALICVVYGRAAMHMIAGFGGCGKLYSKADIMPPDPFPPMRHTPINTREGMFGGLHIMLSISNVTLYAVPHLNPNAVYTGEK